MLTGNLDLYRRTMQAPDAIAYLRGEATRAGKPIRYILYQGNGWLVPAPDLQSVVYREPRTLRRVIGPLHVGPPLTCVRRADGQVLFAAWRLGDAGSEAERSR